jgi:hypothetical protein
MKVIIPKAIRVEPKIYNTLRSFLDSSLKDEHSWNTGVVLPNTHVAIFTKKGKWILNVNHNSATLFTKDYKQVLLVEPHKYVLETKCSTYEEIRDRIVLVDGRSYVDIDPRDLTLTYVIPEPPVSFYLPLPLSQIVDKAKIYYKVFIETIPKDLKCYKECYTNC